MHAGNSLKRGNYLRSYTYLRSYIMSVVRYFELNAFETSDTILSKEAAAHITERHLIHSPNVKKSLFDTTFPLEEKLKEAGWYTWETDYPGVTILDKGCRKGHGYFFIYVFTYKVLVGFDPEGFPAVEMAIYYSVPKKDEKWEIITAYPFTSTYDAIFTARKGRPRFC